MKHLQRIADLRDWRRQAGRVVFVPTMGALHEGHAALVRAARRLAGLDGQVAVSIFVNPLQFGPNEDFDRYPRTLEADLALCAASGANLVFAPPVDEVYHPDRSIQVLESRLSRVLCGASRPGHFDGVCTVVAKLFNLVQPDDAIFGKKDYQQLAILRRLVRDLDFPVHIHGVDTVREADGLALSSRNRYLSPEERAQAPALQAALQLARTAWLGGETDAAALLARVRSHLATAAPLGRIDYAELVNRHTLESQAAADAESLLALAVFFGRARLIDNLEFSSADEAAASSVADG
jgi:pantoate--beta-alanine ligase